MADIGELRYDQGISDGFAKHFVAGGFAESLVDYARGKYPIDFQYRKDPKHGTQWATLYGSLTAVLNVNGKGAKGLALDAHATYRQRSLGWSEEWTAAAAVPTWTQRWDQVEASLERVIPKVVKDGRFITTEGILQAAVSGYLGGAARVILDREVCPRFRDAETKRTIQDLYSDQLCKAIANRQPAPGAPPKRYGMECDALAIDAAGHLVAIEIKPGSAGTLAWAAAQATMYAKVLQHWVDKDPTWRSTIEKSFVQRRALGLVPPAFTLPGLKPAVVPAVAFQRVVAASYVARMYDVQDALLAEKVGDPALTFYTVAPSGRLDHHQRP